MGYYLNKVSYAFWFRKVGVLLNFFISAVLLLLLMLFLTGFANLSFYIAKLCLLVIPFILKP